MSNVSYRVKIDAEPCKSYPGLAGPTIQGQEVKDFSAETLKKIEEHDLLPYEVIHKAKVNITNDRIIIEEYDEGEFDFEEDFVDEIDTNVDKTEEKEYHNNENYICGTVTSTGRECRRAVEAPDETCWQH